MEKLRKQNSKLYEKIDAMGSTELKKFVRTMDKTELYCLKLYLDDIYYNTGESKLDDWRYDIISWQLEKNSSYVPIVGAPLRFGDNRVKLPFWLGSTDKITEQKDLDKWLEKNQSTRYILSDKLDGVSCLLVYDKGEIKLFTRGDGVEGADISYLSKYIRLPEITGGKKAFRGELIIKNSVFSQKYKNKKIGNRTYKNARNMVSGLVGSKTARTGLSDIDFIPYEKVSDVGDLPSRQLEEMKNLNFNVVHTSCVVQPDCPTINSLSEYYIQRCKDSDYQLDGIVVQTDLPYDRNISGNPKYMFAFKLLMGKNIHTTTVTDVEWNASQWGQIKPVAIFEPVELKEITMSRATAHNGKYVLDNGIGPGAVIEITRSKDVIPYIVRVVKPCENIKYPEVKWKWDSNKVNFLIQEEDSGVQIKLITRFFSFLGVKYVSEATITKLFNGGFDNILKIISASKEELLKIPGFKERTVERMKNNIHSSLQNVSLSKVLGASGIFGNGIAQKRLDMLFLDIPDLLKIYRKISKEELKQKILSVEGFSDIMATKIIKGVKLARSFVKSLKPFATFKKDERVSDELKGKKFVVTGFRDKEMEEKIKSRGGKITGTVSSNTTALIIKNRKENEEIKQTGKIKKAISLGIKVYEKDDFQKEFLK